MCNHFRADIKKARAEFEEWGYEEFSETRINIFGNQLREDIYPDYPALVGRLDETGKLVPDLMRWGFPPPPAARQVVTNVRNTASPFWRRSLKAEYRCLVPATEFAEFSYVEPKGERWFKTTDDKTFCFAGIWMPWSGTRGTKKDPVTGEHKLFAFLTTEPNEIVKPHHPKAMPVILAREDWGQWLTGSTEDALKLQRPALEGCIALLNDRSR